jgi:hypothetical protein
MILYKFGYTGYIGSLRTNYVSGKVHIRKIDLIMRLSVTRKLLTTIVFETL